MDFAARAAERSEPSHNDAHAAPPRARLDVSCRETALPVFAPLLGAVDAGAPAGLVGAWRTDGHFHLFVPPQFDAHVLAWRIQPGKRAKISDPVALAALRDDGAWRATLMPRPGAADRPVWVSGLAVVDADGLRARYEFVWTRTSSGWRSDDAPDVLTAGNPADKPARPAAVEPVAATLRGMWAESCGRCLRYPLGRRPGTPLMALCRRDCLSTFSPF